MSTRFLVFTDLDGTLLDHETYDHAPARAALAALAARGVPVIPNTSKTRAELLDWCSRLGLDGPFIVENGSALITPATALWRTVGEPGGDPNTIVFGAPLGSIRRALESIEAARRFDYTGLLDMTTAELARATGLDPDAAARAQARQYSEPLLWRDTASALETFSAEISRAGLRVTRGGRFVHVMGNTDKGVALKCAAKIAAANSGAAVRTIALGDSPNDAEMLNAADIAVVIANPHSAPPSIDHSNALYTSAVGPAGWQEAMDELLRSQLH